METPINFNEKKGFICDMDGVIYHGNRIDVYKRQVLPPLRLLSMRSAASL